MTLTKKLMIEKDGFNADTINHWIEKRWKKMKKRPSFNLGKK